jgi:glycine dehydrogenase subunit 1
MRELGQHLVRKTLYAAKKMVDIKSVRLRFHSAPFKEFVVDFSQTGKSVAEINGHLLGKGIFGGKDLSAEFSGLRNCSLYCFTEMVTQADIDRLVSVLKDYFG